MLNIHIHPSRQNYTIVLFMEWLRSHTLYIHTGTHTAVCIYLYTHTYVHPYTVTYKHTHTPNADMWVCTQRDTTGKKIPL